VPVISAVGHEIDFTLCDFAADRRAETPSAAAELITSQFVGCVERARQAGDTMDERVATALARAGERLDHARSRLRLLSPEVQIEQGHLRLDDLSNRLAAALRHSIQERRRRYGELRDLLDRRSPQTRVERESQRLLSLWKRLQAVSPASVLNRGFVILSDESGRPVARRVSVRAGQVLAATFSDGTVPVRAE
jgi:exodeoxyribonuclease VII large subunit